MQKQYRIRSQALILTQKRFLFVDNNVLHKTVSFGTKQVYLVQRHKHKSLICNAINSKQSSNISLVSENFVLMKKNETVVNMNVHVNYFYFWDMILCYFLRKPFGIRLNIKPGFIHLL